MVVPLGQTIAAAAGATAPLRLPHWEDPPDKSGRTAFDKVILKPDNGPAFTLPGIAIVDVEPEQRLDVNKPKGRAGATLTDDGPAPSKVKITLTLVTKADWEAFQACAQYFRPPPGKPNVPKLDITHPTCALWGVRSVLAHKPRGPKYSNEGAHKGYVFEIDCLEYYPPRSGDVTKTTGARDPKNLPPSIFDKPSSTVATISPTGR